MTVHAHTNPTASDLEKDEEHEAHEMNTAQLAKIVTDRVRQRASKDAAGIKARNAANAKGFPEDD